VLAVMVAPDRVVVFAADDALSRPLALLKGVWLALASGYKSSTAYPPIDRLLTRGGMESMLNTIWLIITALSFGGVVEKVGVIERLIDPVVSAVKSIGMLVTALVGAVLATNVVTADQFIAIVLPARMFRNGFRSRGLAPVVLSRSVGDSGTVTGALIPWNSCGAYLAATLGVGTFHYAPFAIFCWLSPLIAIAFAFFGVRMLRSAEPQLVGAAAAPPT
jgi:NhaC family Na+:H+ antiporter